MDQLVTQGFPAALGDLEKNISADDFREVDDDMWK